MSSIQILQRTTEPIPFELLLIADPSKEQIEKYLRGSIIFLAKNSEVILGVLVLKINNSIGDIMNVSVKEQHQGRGIGTRLIQHAIQFAYENQISKLEIGTADTSHSQLRLYNKLGFLESGRIKNFFIQNYPDPIIENGKQAKDMIRLEMSLT